jgi:hypothetical protein
MIQSLSRNRLWYFRFRRWTIMFPKSAASFLLNGCEFKCVEL